MNDSLPLIMAHKKHTQTDTDKEIDKYSGVKQIWFGYETDSIEQIKITFRIKFKQI